MNKYIATLLLTTSMSVVAQQQAQAPPPLPTTMAEIRTQYQLISTRQETLISYLDHLTEFKEYQANLQRMGELSQQAQKVAADEAAKKKAPEKK